MYELRLRRLFLAFCVVLCLIAARAFALQVLDAGPSEDRGGSWKSRAGRPRPFTIHARRGEIYYADGTPMAWNVPGYGLEIAWGEVDDRIVPTPDEFRASIAWRAAYEARRDADRLAEQRTESQRTRLAAQQAERRAQLAEWRAERLDDLTRLRAKFIDRDDGEPVGTRWECTICGTQRKSRGEPTRACGECRGLPAYEPVPLLPVEDLAAITRNDGDDPLELCVARVHEALAVALRRRERRPDWRTHAFLVKIPAFAAETIDLKPAEFGGFVPVARTARKVDAPARQIAGGTRFPTEEDVRDLSHEDRLEQGLHRYSPGDVLPTLIGNSLLESIHDEDLRGIPGEGQHVRRRDDGFARSVEVQREVLDGEDLHTTVRPGLQALAVEIAQASSPGDAGAAVVIDVRDGALLAMASSSRDGMNHARSHIIPGSVFKLVTSVAALESGLDPEESLYCEGGRGRFSKGVRYSCHGCGEVALHGAFVHSCNKYFAHRAIMSGADAMTVAAQRLGFDVRPLVPALGERGTYESDTRERHVLGTAKRIHPPDLANIGIGQGTIQASAVQVVTAYARIAANGRKITPYVLRRDRVDPASIAVDPVLARFAPMLRDAARGVVSEPGGTAFKQQGLRDVGAAGKTGTAELEDRSTGTKRILNNTLFVGYAPHDDPRYCAIVVYERMPEKRYGAEATGEQVARLLREALRE